MNREHLPCSACFKFVPAKTGSGHCTGFDRPAEADDRPCVLFAEQGSWETRKGQMPSTAGQRPRREPTTA
jgi:hypothetical protein